MEKMDVMLLIQGTDGNWWRQVRGPAGFVMCETRDLGTKWSQWHTLTFEGQVQVDMRHVCPKDMKKMLIKQARIERMYLD